MSFIIGPSMPFTIPASDSALTMVMQHVCPSFSQPILNVKKYRIGDRPVKW